MPNGAILSVRAISFFRRNREEDRVRRFGERKSGEEEKKELGEEK